MTIAKREANRTNAQNFRLSREDYELYLKLNQSLLVYSAQKLNPRLNVENREDFVNLPNEQKFSIRNFLIKRINLIDEFVSVNPCNFISSELEIIKSWKNYVRGNFFLVDYRENGAVFLEEEDENPKAYLVLALGTPLWELIPVSPPARLETVLLPFKGRIIYDGLVNADRIFFGPHMARSLRTVLDRSIMKHGLVESLPYQGPVGLRDDEKLAFYLSTKERREDNWEEIEELLENKKLLPIFMREMGKANCRSLKKRLKKAGVKKGWFAIANDVVVASGKTEEDLKRLVDELIPDHGKESVYIFKFN